MITTRTAMIISLGLFLGVLNYGIQTTLVNYNRLVNPEQPLQIITVEKKDGEVVFMGESFTMEKVRGKLTLMANEFKEMAGDAYCKLVLGYHRFLNGDGH